MNARILAFALLFGGTPALADTVAVYSVHDGQMLMTIEVASNGDVRGEMGGKLFEELRAKAMQQGLPADQVQAPSMLTLAGEGYLVQPTPQGPAVLSVRDMTAVMAEFLAQHPESNPSMSSEPPRVVAGGPVTINGRTGTAYFMGGKRSDQQRPLMVLSADPELAELGRAMANQFAMSAAMGNTAFGWGDRQGGIVALLRAGAPLRFAGMELVSVRHDPIPPAHFVLPAPPKSRDEVRAIMRRSGDASGPAPAPPPPPAPAPRP